MVNDDRMHHGTGGVVAFFAHRPLAWFFPPPTLYWPLLGVTLFSYVLLTQGVKLWLLRKAWI